MIDSERAGIPFRCGFWSISFLAEFVLDLYKVNHGILGVLNWGTFKKSTLNFAIFCSGYENHTRKRLNSDVSSLKVQDKSYGKQSATFICEFLFRFDCN